MEACYRDQYRALWKDHWWWQARQRLVMRVFRRLNDQRVPAVNRPAILDIGCAGGLAFEGWSEFGEVYGIEPDEGFLTDRTPWSARIEHAAFDRDYESPRTYDFVVMLDVLEHIEDDQGALRSLFRLLKPGGQAIITVPAFPCLWSRHDEANLHFRRYTRSSLLNVSQQAGLVTSQSFYFFSWSLPLVYLRKWLARGTAESYQVRIPPPLVNSTFRGMSLVEDCLRSRLAIFPPWGSSLLTVVQRPATECPVGETTKLALQPVYAAPSA